MRSFNEREKDIIRKLLNCDSDNQVTIQDFLKENYFKAALSRALIIQNQGEYAVFFLSEDVFENPVKKKKEISYFFELISLLTFLCKSRYILLYRETNEKLYFIQDEFDSQKIIHNKIILNTKGDYTTVPDTINDVNNKPIYKGIEFRNDQYKLIHEATTGTLIISERLKELMEKTDNKNTVKPDTSINTSETKPGETKHSTRLWPLIICFLSILLCFCAIIVLYLNIRKHDEKLAELNSRHRSVSDSLKFVSNALIEFRANQHQNTNEVDKYYGIDISKWNGNEAEDIKRRDSISFIICKATEGITIVDAEFDKNWDIIREKNCLLGVYHFYHIAEDPVKQAEHFYNTVSVHGNPDIPLIVDIEQESLPSGNKPDIRKMQSELLRFLTHIKTKSGKTPMIYSDFAFADEYLRLPAFSEYSLWLADYTEAPKPRLPEAWKEKGYKIWQKRDNYYINTHTTDFDVFYGKKTDLSN